MKAKPLNPSAKVFLISAAVLTAVLLAGCDGQSGEFNYPIQIEGPRSIVLGDDFRIELIVTGLEETLTGKFDITDSNGAGCKGMTLDANGRISCLMSSSHLSAGTEKITGTYLGRKDIQAENR